MLGREQLFPQILLIANVLGKDRWKPVECHQLEAFGVRAPEERHSKATMESVKLSLEVIVCFEIDFCKPKISVNVSAGPETETGTGSQTGSASNAAGSRPTSPDSLTVG